MVRRRNDDVTMDIILLCLLYASLFSGLLIGLMKWMG